MSKILIVEDDAALRNDLVEALQYEGFDAIDARDGIEGLQCVRSEPPDLIVCDIRLPELDGFGLKAELDKDPQTATIPVIFITANQDLRTQIAGRQAGAVDYLKKPFQFDEFLARIRQHLDA